MDDDMFARFTRNKKRPFRVCPTSKHNCYYKSNCNALHGSWQELFDFLQYMIDANIKHEREEFDGVDYWTFYYYLDKYVPTSEKHKALIEKLRTYKILEDEQHLEWERQIQNMNLTP